MGGVVVMGVVDLVRRLCVSCVFAKKIFAILPIMSASNLLRASGLTRFAEAHKIVEQMLPQVLRFLRRFVVNDVHERYI